MSTCGTGSGNVLGTKFTKNCLESRTQVPFLTKEGFRFNSVADLQNKTKWEAAIEAEDIIPLFELYELNQENKDAEVYESGNFSYESAKAIKVLKAEVYLSLCAHRSFKTLENSEYTRILEVTEANEVLVVKDDDGKLMGQLLKKFDVGIRNNSTNGKSPFTTVTLTYADFEELENSGYIYSLDFSPMMSLSGIYSLELEVISYNTAENKMTVKVTSGCGIDLFTGMVAANFKVTTDSVTPTTIDSVTPAGDGFYVIELNESGEGIVSTDGVITVSGSLAKSPDVQYKFV